MFLLLSKWMFNRGHLHSSKKRFISFIVNVWVPEQQNQVVVIWEACGGGQGLNGAKTVNGKNVINFLEHAFVSEAMAAASQWTYVRDGNGTKTLWWRIWGSCSAQDARPRSGLVPRNSFFLLLLKFSNLLYRSKGLDKPAQGLDNQIIREQHCFLLEFWFNSSWNPVKLLFMNITITFHY